MSSSSENQLFEYRSQLSSVNEALKYADNEQRADLLDLKGKLEEVLILLEGSQNDSLKKDLSTKSKSTNESNIDDEFAKFQMELSLLEGTSQETNANEELSDSSESEQDNGIDELVEAMASLEGSKCRAPFSQPWGEKEYHNALIVSVDFDPQTVVSVEDVEVEVMFCHPTCDQMKPCSFFLNGYCKFSGERCRFSHGHRVRFSELREFILPDYGNIVVDSKCLAQSSDSLWYRATIEKCLEDRKFIVKYDRTGRTDTLDAHCVIPLEVQESHNGCYNDENKGNEESDVSFNNCSSVSSSNAFANLSFRSPSVAVWEQHTTGIGSKLMEKMGHIWGQGLGKNSDGRLDPVEAMILPAGKSLDKCIEMRDNCNPKGPVSVETRLTVEQDKEEQRVKRVKNSAPSTKKETVFDFINSRIAKAKGESREIEIRKGVHLTDDKSKSQKDLNIQVFAVGEDIKKTKKEISKLRLSLVRNSERNEVVRAQVEKKIAVQNDILKNLQSKEQKINQEIKSQTNNKKLSVF